jgi:aminopeptidase-like protein
MKQLIEDLYPINRCLLGKGYAKALHYLGERLTLEVLEFPSGTQFDTWTIPDEWVVRGATLKYGDEVILDYADQPLSLIVGSLPYKGEVDRDTLLEHLHYSEADHSAFLYEYKFYERNWGFTMPKDRIYDNKELLLKEGTYTVDIDTEYRPGKLQIGVHTIPGKSDREILLFAHLDHPFQANDNLSAVACLVELAKEVKSDYTIKIIFCPETIGSIAYAHTQDLSKVEFVLALDAVGNANPEGILLQKAFDLTARVNRAAHLALRGLGEGYRQGIFRSSIGSDEYVFNDPKIGVPGIMLSTHPYPEYHTSKDDPSIIDYKQIETVKNAVLKTIEYYEKDFIPERTFKGPLFRSGFGIQTQGAQLNFCWDYLIYSIDGKKTFSELCVEYGLNFEYTLERIERLITAGAIVRRPIDRKGDIKKAPRKKSKAV